ncbi:MAG: alpha/beta fold hydrolase [Hyphomonadaceae bacterium]|nr:alpha/beta fold hydrolase [Hyphomonadaceae bacterium]
MPDDIRALHPDAPSHAPSSAPEPWEPDPAGYLATFATLDRALHASVARLTLGLSPRALMSAYSDWAAGLLFSPGKQAQLVHKAERKWSRFASFVQHRLSEPSDSACIEPLPQDKRFADEAWRQAPFCFMSQAFLLTQQWWHNATTGVSGVTPQHERAVEFAARQWLDIFSPSNFLWTNPVVLEATLRQGGANLYRGWLHAMEDLHIAIAGDAPAGAESFKIGENIAATPGKVVYRNELMELIQYAPSTAQARPEPILIIPAWIMKYYILDLSPENSLVRRLVDEGFTVFMISWKNPGPDDRDLGMDDYRRLGPMAALDRIGEIAPDRKVHAVGYCLGGALLAIAAASMARDRDARMQSLTLLAAQVDFEEAGELMLFTNEKQIAFLDDLMWEQGFLDSRQMAGAFQLLRSNDLVWSRMVREYLMGERTPVSDLTAWNADGTRLPYKMHSEYLKRLFLGNDLSEGRYRVGDRTIALSDIAAPIFAVATETDHVSPWRSVYKLHQLTRGELTFLLTNGGHNAGIVSDPRDPWRAYRMMTRAPDARQQEPEQWLRRAAAAQGSWWPAWLEWLAARSGAPVMPPWPPADALSDAPGDYVLME